MENAVFIRKAFGDYINSRNDKYMSGEFWEIKHEGIVIRLPASAESKKSILSLVSLQFGNDVEIYERVA